MPINVERVGEDEEPVTCKHCKVEFESKGRYQTHYRQEHEEDIRNRQKNGDEARITRDMSGKFICGCGKGYMVYQSLQRHMKTCSEWRNIENEEDINQSSEEGTVPFEIMRRSHLLFLLNVLTIGEGNDHNSTAGQHEAVQVISKSEIPLVHDLSFNLLVCSECHIAIPHDWVVAHLKKNHGITKTLEEISHFLSLEEHSMSSVEVRDWLDSVWVIPKPIGYVPVISGYHCLVCNYCCQGEKVLIQHFKLQHRGESWKQHHEISSIQQPFKGQLSKYLLIESSESVDAPSYIIPHEYIPHGSTPYPISPLAIN